jgi:hypothetical protein
MAFYRKKPVVIEAVQNSGTTQIDTLEGVMTAISGDWIITGVKGEKYPCKDDIFRMTYEPLHKKPHDVEEFYKDDDDAKDTTSN